VVQDRPCRLHLLHVYLRISRPEEQPQGYAWFVEYCLDSGFIDIFSGSHSYTDYVSNWNDISCSIWAILNCVLAYFPQAPDFFYSALSATNAIAPTFSIGVAGAFWCLLPADRQSTDIVSLHQHGFLAIITVADLIFSAAPIRHCFNLIYNI